MTVAVSLGLHGTAPASLAFGGADDTNALAMSHAALAMNAALTMHRRPVRAMSGAYYLAKVQIVVVRNLAPAFARLSTKHIRPDQVALNF